MNEWIVGAFYTPDTPYEQVIVNYLLPSAEAAGLRMDFRESKNYKSWNRNVAEKPRIILDILEDLPPDQCLVFLDADATIESYPILFDTIPADIDIAYHVLDWNRWYGYKCGTQELLTGTMFFRNNERVKELCREWHREAVRCEMWEQQVLQQLIYTHIANGLNALFLPIEYCYMVSLPDGRPPLVKCEPVITHHQLSRKFKRGI